MEFCVVGHPDAVVVEDDLFHYLVVMHDSGYVDVFRTAKGGVYQIHKCFINFEHFEVQMPNVSRVVKEDAKKTMLLRTKQLP